MSVSILRVLLIFIGVISFCYGDKKTIYNVVKLRQGYEYSFNLTFTGGERTAYISEAKYDCKEQYHLSKNSKKKIIFSFTKNIKNLNYKVLSKQKIIIINTNFYDISYHPPKRDKSNLTITYTTKYYEWNGKSWEGPYTNIDIQPYAVTWCGDGIVDDYIDDYSNDIIKEECDPEDKKKKNWGEHGCNKDTCKPY